MKHGQKSKIGNKRERIIEVASSLMSQKGFKGASLQEIADVVGIHKSTLFHYFKNKEELLLVVLKISIEEVTKNLNLILEDVSLSPEEKLRQAIINHLDLLVKYKDNVTVYHSEIRFLSGKKRRKYLETRKYYASCLEQIIEEVKDSDSGYFRGLDTKIVTYGVLGMCNWAIKWFSDSGAFTTLDIANIYYQMITQRGNL